MNETPADRDDYGPFLLLGVDKDADAATVQSHCVERMRWLDEGAGRFQRADLEWAQGELADAEARLAADLNHLNPDLASGAVGRLTRLYHLDGTPPGWEPLDPEPTPALPGGGIIDATFAAATLPPPAAPLDFPSLDRWAANLLHVGGDPWSENLFG